MKRSFAFILVLLILLLSCFVSSGLGSFVSPQDEYFQNDSQLSLLRDGYADMVRNRDDQIERYENMRLNTYNAFYYARSLASKENSLRNVDVNIKNSLSSIEARKAYLEISYRDMLTNLNDSTVQMNKMNKIYEEKSKDFSTTSYNYKLGIISKMSFLQAEYDKKSALNKKLQSQRAFEKALRSFNLKMGRPINSQCPEMVFDERIVSFGDLDVYLETALSYSPDILSIKQQIQTMETEKKHLDSFNIPISFNYVRDYTDTLQINLEIAHLRLENTINQKMEWIKSRYEYLQIETEKLNLLALDKKLNREIYETNKNLNSLGYLSNKALTVYKENYEKAIINYYANIYQYNTKIKQFEYDCAFYNREVYTP